MKIPFCALSLKVTSLAYVKKQYLDTHYLMNNKTTVKKRILNFLAIISSLLLTLSCGDGDGPGIVQKGSRLLAIEVNETPSVSYASALSDARSLGVDEVNIAFDWSVLEPAPGVYDTSQLKPINDLFGANGVPITLNMRPVNGPRLTMPADIAGFDFDSPFVTNRAVTLFNFILSELPDVNFNSFVVGSEVDLFLESNNLRWNQYEDFMVIAVAKIKDNWGTSMPVGTIITYDGLMSANTRDFASSMNNHTDIVCTTYFPIDNNFQMEDPANVSTDLTALVQRYSTREIHLQAAGYASAATINGSEERQAQFVRNLFGFWDAQNNRITKINFYWQQDRPSGEVSQLVDFYNYDGTPQEDAFEAFIESLGLRTQNGIPKEGWATLEEEAGARGW